MTPLIPGELLPETGELELNSGRPVTTVTVANSGDRPVQVGSHFHFAEANAALKFDRQAARGQRLEPKGRQNACWRGNGYGRHRSVNSFSAKPYMLTATPSITINQYR